VRNGSRCVLAAIHAVESWQHNTVADEVEGGRRACHPCDCLLVGSVRAKGSTKGKGGPGPAEMLAYKGGRLRLEVRRPRQRVTYLSPRAERAHTTKQAPRRCNVRRATLAVHRPKRPMANISRET
jgi:hypothetical protein